MSRRTVLATTWTQVRRPPEIYFNLLLILLLKMTDFVKEISISSKTSVIRVPLTTFGAIMAASVDRGRFQIQTTLHNIFLLFLFLFESWMDAKPVSVSTMILSDAKFIEPFNKFFLNYKT